MNETANNNQAASKSTGGRATPEGRQSKAPASSWVVGAYLLLVTVVVVYLLLAVWPVTDAEGGWLPHTALPFLDNAELADDVRLLLIVVLSGAAGSCIGAQTSFATYVGNRALVRSWNWWYVLRPFIGMTLALVFYFVIRGGLLSVDSDATEMSPYGVAAVAALVGLFSKQAMDKLEEVFTTMFRTKDGKGDDLRGDKAVDEAQVSQHMILLRKIKAYAIPAGKKNSDILISNIAALIQPGITRIPLLNARNVAQGVIHQSLLFKYIAEMSIELQRRQQSFDFDNATLEQLLDYGEMRELIESSMAFVTVDATIAEAKSAMDKLDGCQDVFVTQTGDRAEPILGWLTNVDIGNLQD